MTNNFNDLAMYLQPLLKQLSTDERSQLARKVGRDLRESQKSRIISQRNPDGSGYTPRRKRLREQKGKIRRKMFTKLNLNTHLRLSSTADKISIGFVGRVAKIANVHQHGLKDRITRGGPNIVYSKREILGLTEKDIKMIGDLSLKHINI